MFSYHMSYTELLRALHYVAHRPRNQGVLTNKEWTCLEESLKTPLLTSLLRLYPLPRHLRKIVDTTIAQRRLRNDGNDFDDGVHAAVYGDERGKTQRWLQNDFPVELSLIHI